MVPIMPDQPNELILTESRTMRAQTVTRVDVLDKVKTLSLLPDNVHATTEIVASYYEVDTEVIKKTVQRHREELASNGLRVIRGDELRDFKRSTEGQSVPLSERINALTLFTRRTILNVGQLLAESDVARQVRTYLLEVEELASPDVRSQAVGAVELSESRMRVLKLAQGIVDASWLETKARVLLAKALGEEPEVDPLDVPLYVPDFLKGLGLKRKQIESVQSWFGRRAVTICDELNIDAPEKRQSDLSNGTVRETKAWTERHRPVFELTWARHYAADFPTQTTLPSIPSQREAGAL
ncbi:hypothetical protein [Streptomyces sp. NPDC058869]|uniref:hypothetical protein n=1 Tax=Streptomyces sp. NPDC058869 TaxID=3346659 RepID=UPI0036C25081